MCAFAFCPNDIKSNDETPDGLAAPSAFLKDTDAVYMLWAWAFARNMGLCVLNVCLACPEGVTCVNHGSRRLLFDKSAARALYERHRSFLQKEQASWLMLPRPPNSTDAVHIV
jgi:hypothetical protein